ncbi:MAG TPA: O-antigen ligase family protein [Chloroflexia bacterium]|nr:O-antigen ligase family protein [Chloroflexia bacterium]
MLADFQTRIQDNSALRTATVVLLGVGVGVFGGLAVAMGNPVVPFVALVALLVLPWLVTRPLADVALVIGTVMLLPFAVLPVRLAVLTPTLLEMGLLFLYISWLLSLLFGAGQGVGVARTPLDGWVLVFLASTLFSFVGGLTRDSSSDVVHNYIKLVLSVGLFFAAGSVIRDSRTLATVMRWLLLAGGAAAALGLVLWRLPDALATSLLTRLSVVGYPTGRVIRYVEDNPALGERAVGTQVDPNSFGGLLMIVAVITGVQLLARKPLLPRWLLGGIFLAEVGAIVLTQSRSALGGVLVGAVFVATLRYRRLWLWGVAGAGLLLVVGAGSGYFARIAAGLRFEDPASLMRLAEYRNALAIIERYPVFGVGFGTAGELDLTTGVSSLYLTIAERAGLVALALFVIAMLAFFAHMLPAIIASRRAAPAKGDPAETEWSVLDSTLLGGTAAMSGALISVGPLDHFYFNIEFPHMVALFWLTASLTLTAWRMTKTQRRKDAKDAQRG